MSDHIEWVAVRATETPEIYAAGVHAGGFEVPTDDEVSLRVGFGDGAMICGTKADVLGWLTNALNVLDQPEKWVQPEPDDHTVTVLLVGEVSEASASLRDKVMPLITDGGCSVEVLAGFNRITQQKWLAADRVIVLDGHTADVLARHDRRPLVILVSDDMDDAGIWRRAVDIGAEHVVVLPDGQQWLRNWLTA